MRKARRVLITGLSLGCLFFLAATLGCSPKSDKLMPAPVVTNDKVDTDGGTEVFDPSVDILFVVDDSGSMMTHQTNLANNITRFVSAFTKRGSIDYHIGVINSTMDTWSGTPNCCGKLVGYPHFVDRNTPNVVNVLARNLKVGTNGSGTERFFDPIMAALSAPLVNTDNLGFYRSNSHLAVVYITDAEDQSRASEKDVYDFLVKLKGRKEKLISYGVIVPSNVDDCERDDVRPPMKIEAFLARMPNAGKNVFSLCDPVFGDRVAEIADDLVRYIGNVIYLSRPPILKTVEVTFGTQVIPPDIKKGWSFDPERNALVLGEDIIWSTQANGTKVKVYYEAASYPNQ